MKILIIGGTRFFGKRFVQLMLNQGHSMTLLTRGKITDNFGNRVTRIVADRTDIEQLKNVMKSDYDVVVDNILMNAKEANDIISILGHRAKHFVMTSTLSVYDPRPEALYESDYEAIMPQPGDSYQQGKRSAEHALLNAPFTVSIMRIPVIVGPDDYTGRLLTHVNAVKDHKKLYFPNPDARFSYLHAQDAARALKWFCDERPSGVFNISAPNSWPLKKLIECIERIVGRKFTYGNINDEYSPFGVAQDYYMNVDKAQHAGFQVEPLEKWMPTLIETLKKSQKSE
jgi:nucleoside-diphosphate-sugar epimerase